MSDELSVESTGETVGEAKWTLSASSSGSLRGSIVIPFAFRS